MAFDGEGSRRYGGRWNSKGKSVIYLAQSVAGAMLEILVNTGASQLITQRYLIYEVDIPDSQVKRLSNNLLRPG